MSLPNSVAVRLGNKVPGEKLARTRPRVNALVENGAARSRIGPVEHLAQNNPTGESVWNARRIRNADPVRRERRTGNRAPRLKPAVQQPRGIQPSSPFPRSRGRFAFMISTFPPS